MQRNVQDPVGIVYGDGKPIGFLQPYSRVYQMTSDELNTNQPNKREYVDIFYPIPKQSIEDNSEVVFTGDRSASKYSSEYPSVLTNFKIDSKLKNREQPPRRIFEKDYPAKISKRETDARGITKENIDKLRSVLQNYEETPQNKANVQEILNEMGFAEVNGGVQKRESSQEEDEDMEKGVNAIRLVKETHDVEKRKSKKSSKQKVKGEENEGEKDAVAEDYEEDEEEKPREKRDDDSAPQSQNSELMKNLEKSGELTVSGNKSPLASAGSDAPKEEKPKSDKESDSEEERVAREIQAKIDAIKDQVKRQIAEQNKETQNRKKRDVKNLLSEESLRIDPQYNFEEEAETHHVRRKRNAEASSSENPHDRRKRENRLRAPYREDDEEVDEEDDEFEDDGFDDRTAKLAPGKRAYSNDPHVVDDLEWENSMLYDQFVRKKRHSPEGDRKIMQHLGAIRERSEMPKGYPKTDEEGLKDAPQKLQQIADMSDADLFGPLPEGYEGELTRYKRVKRERVKGKRT